MTTAAAPAPAGPPLTGNTRSSSSSAASGSGDYTQGGRSEKTLEDFNTMARKYGLDSDPNPSSVENLFPMLLAKEDCDPESLTYQLARTYVPFLGASSYEKICGEPASLKNELHFIRHEMENLAAQNVGSFLGNTTLAATVTDEDFPEILRRYKSLSHQFDSLKTGLEEFHADVAPQLAKEREEFRTILQKYTPIQELLEIPQLLDACIRSQLFDESLDLIAFASHLFQSHRARIKRLKESASGDQGSGAASLEVPLLDLLESQVAAQRTHFEQSLLGQLGGDIHLPACVRVIGYLRRLGGYSENQIRALFLEQRSTFVGKHKRQIEKNVGSSPVTCLRAASDLMRTYVFDIGMHYKALFFQSVSGHDRKLTEIVFSNWLQLQLRWFLDLLGSQMAVPDQETGRALAPVVSLDAAALATIFKCVQHCSNTMKMLGCQFFPAVQGMFNRRVLYLVSSRLDLALENFQMHLQAYDWMGGGATAAAAAAGGPSSSFASGTARAGQQATMDLGNQFLVDNALKLMAHRPLGILANDFIATFNELRQCALAQIRKSVCVQIENTCVGVVNVLVNYQIEHQGNDEFAALCGNFKSVFLPLVAAHVRAIYPQAPAQALDMAAIVGRLPGGGGT